MRDHAPACLHRVRSSRHSATTRYHRAQVLSERTTPFCRGGKLDGGIKRRFGDLHARLDGEHSDTPLFTKAGSGPVVTGGGIGPRA